MIGLGALMTLALLADKPGWTFDPNTLRLTGGDVTAVLRPVGDMHGVVIEKLGDAASPVAPGRAFLNLEHYLEAGRWAEYLPRKLDHSVVMDRRRLTIRFPRPPDWPVVSELTYTFTKPGAIDARLDFAFTGKLRQFEVYFTSYFARQYERSIRTKGQWLRPQIGPGEQVLIARDDRVADRFGDGRWGFLKGRIRLAEERFDLPVMVSRDDATGWTVVQMIEPGACTHIAPNRFAVGHNFIIGGWDVDEGDKRSARIRLITGRNLSDAEVEKEFRAFAEECGKGAGTGN
ncbi:MAG: hypothetical protein HRF43_11370 [Phycisphaerae bacterium]|jgi:hypothetical protein